MLRQSTHVAHNRCAACVFAFVMASCGGSGTDEPGRPPVVEFRQDASAEEYGSVDVSPLSREALSAFRASTPRVEDWQRVLSVYVGDTAGQGLPMLGAYHVAGDTLRFKPRFLPAPGAAYVARFDSRALYARIKRPGPTHVATGTWSVAADTGASITVVREVYPTTGDVPMNLLKMYVEFSAPMSTGRSYDHIKVYAERDSLLEEPFFTAGGTVELWDPDKRRLTILFDPGRIKRDLKPNEERGLPLREGGRYRLVIDTAMRDARGRPLLRGYEKRFRVRGVDRTLVRTTEWIVKAPRAGTRDSLVLVFPEPLDRALLGRLLVVRDSSGRPIAGDAGISDRETRWAFAPRNVWLRAPHSIEVDTELEDLAGNNLKRLFDVAPGDVGAVGVRDSRVRVGFAPAANVERPSP